MGDGVLVYFGYPRAHEHDAERAVRAALVLSDAVHEAEPRLHRRCGCVSECVRSGRGRGPHRIRRGAGARRGRGDAQPRRTAASHRRAGAVVMPKARAGSSAISSSCRSRRQRSQRHSRPGLGPGRCCGSSSKAVSRRCTRPMRPRWSVGRRNRSAVATLGERRNGEGGVLLRARPIGKSRLTARCWSGSGGTARALRYSAHPAHRQRVLSRHRPDGRAADFCVRIPPERSSTLDACWRRPQRLRRMPRSSPRCCRSRTMAASRIRPPPQQRRQKTLRHWSLASRRGTSHSAAHRFRGRPWSDPTTLEAEPRHRALASQRVL